MIPSASEIEYFVEVFRTRHLSKAAIRLSISQPALTISIQKLEHKLGVTLFHRTKQGVKPTKQGVAFYQRASEFLDSWKGIQQGLLQSVTEIEGHFKVGCHQNVGLYTLPKFIENLSLRAPGIQLELHHDFSRNIVEKIISYEIDLGFVVNPVKHPDLVLKKIGIDRVLAWKKDGSDPKFKLVFADLDEEELKNTLGPSHSKKFASWTLITTSSLELIRTLTLSGLGIGILPERVAQAYGEDLVSYDKDLPIFEDQIYVVYRKEVLATKAGQELIKAASSPLGRALA